jgi:hypothetical protein
MSSMGGGYGAGPDGAPIPRSESPRLADAAVAAH